MKPKSKIRQYQMCTPVDGLLIMVILFLAVYSIPYLDSSQPAIVTVYKDNNIYAKYPLNQNHTLSVKGYEGLLDVVIENSTVRIKYSPCKKQICVKSGHISKSFQQLICVPNHILIEIQSKKEKIKFDAITK